MSYVHLYCVRFCCEHIYSHGTNKPKRKTLLLLLNNWSYLSKAIHVFLTLRSCCNGITLRFSAVLSSLASSRESRNARFSISLAFFSSCLRSKHAKSCTTRSSRLSSWSRKYLYNSPSRPCLNSLASGSVFGFFFFGVELSMNSCKGRVGGSPPHFAYAPCSICGLGLKFFSNTSLAEEIGFTFFFILYFLFFPLD